MDANNGRQPDQGNGEGEIPQEALNVLNPPSPLVRLPLPEESVGSLISVPSGSKRRKVNFTTSEVWNHVDKVIVKKDDGSEETKARCKYCNELISYDCTLGIYHLKKHSKDCITKITSKLRRVKQQPPLNNSEHFTFDQAIACRAIVSYIITEELSFNWAANSSFLHFVKSLNPQFKPIPSRTVGNIVMKFFQEEKPILKGLLQSVPGNICLSSNRWTSSNGMGYMCVRVHYVDSDWKLNKRIICFPVCMEFETFEAIYNSILDWNVNEKIFTVTLDTSVSNDVSEKLKEALLVNGSTLCKQMFHVSCGTHILSIIMQEGLKELHELEGLNKSLEYIRESIKHIAYDSVVQQKKFNELCKHEVLPVKRMPLDFPCQWNTTYLMLDAAIPYERVFEIFFSESTFEYIPTDLDWRNARLLRDIMKVFYESVKLFSGVKYVSSSVFFHRLSNICLVISKYENDPSCASVFVSMKSKIKEYWREIPLALGLASCVDPRYKMSFLEVCFEVIYGYEETHRPGGCLEMIKNALKALFEEYKQKPLGSNSVAEEDPTFALYATRERASCASELQSYLDQPSVKISDREAFDVLGWWKTQQLCYPVLTAMARDLLTVAVSSFPLDSSAFNTDGPILNDNRMDLEPDVVEALVCLKDWYEAEAGVQDKNLDKIEDLMKDQGLEEGFEDLNLDDEDEDMMRNIDSDSDSDSPEEKLQDTNLEKEDEDLMSAADSDSDSKL